MNESFLQENNILFGIIFTIAGGYLFKYGKELLNEFENEEYIMASYSIEIAFGGLVFLVLGIILLFFDYPFS